MLLKGSAFDDGDDEDNNNDGNGNKNECMFNSYFLFARHSSKCMTSMDLIFTLVVDGGSIICSSGMKKKHREDK